MPESNPYFQVYCQELRKVQQIDTKEHLFQMAVNMGRVHNLLGIVISDVVKFMGNMRFEQKNQIERPRAQNVENHQNSKHIENKNSSISNDQPRKPSFIAKKIPQKSEKSRNPAHISNQPPVKQNQSNKIQNKKVSSQSEFEDKQKTYQPQKRKKKQETRNSTKEDPYLKQFYRDLFSFSGTQSSQSQMEKMERQNLDEIESSGTSQTQSAEKVRSNNEERRLAAKNSFEDQSHYLKEDHQSKRAINQNKPSKNKSIFAELYDSDNDSQQSEKKPQIIVLPYQGIEIDSPKNFRSQQFHSDESNPFKKPSKKLFSPQTKKERPEENGKNKEPTKTINLLEITTWNVGPSNIASIDEDDDEIEGSSQKPQIKKIDNLKKPSSKFDVPEYDDYVPRREEKGRKKSDRQGLVGSQCPDCKAFYDAISEGSQDFKELCKCTSRHKSSTTFMAKSKVQNFSQDFCLD